MYFFLCIYYRHELTVALVVKKGLCSFAQKAEYASRNIHPPGIVKVLIIDGENRIKDDEVDEIDDYNYNDEEKEFDESTNNQILVTKQQLPSLFDYNDVEDDKNSTATTRTLRRRNHEDDITVAILHVSYQTGYELLDIIMNEDTDAKNAGGMLVKLDSITPPTSRTDVIIWVTLSFLLSCILCCCISNAVSDLFEEPEPEPEPRRRHRRLRLTAEQVVKTFPTGIFDGNQLIYETTTTTTTTNSGACSSSDTCSGTGEKEYDNNHFQPSSHSLDSCTICLDDYSVGHKLRCLPCGHAFHAKCIAKWLIERSATCPLCKIDLYKEEEEDDDDNNEEEIESEQQRNQHADFLQDLFSTTTEPVDDSRSEGSWWRRIWSTNIFNSPGQQRRIDAVTRANETLAEPLLQQQVTDDDGNDGNDDTYILTQTNNDANVQEIPTSDEDAPSTTMSSEQDEETADGGSSSL
jgi:hypothetical protein